MRLALAKEVAAMLNIEAGEPLYRIERWTPETGTVSRDISRSGNSRTVVTVSGDDLKLVVRGQKHPRGFTFGWLQNGKPTERFAWGRIHRRCSKLANEP